MRLKELRGLPVIDPTAARKVGVVTDFQVDPASGRIAALDIDPVEKSDSYERILGHRVRRVGRHAVILTGRAGSSPNTPVELNEHWLDASTLVGLEVMGDDGNRIGKLIDATFDQDSLEIDNYLLRSTFMQRFTGRRGRIQPSKVHSCSRELMVVLSGKVREEQAAVSPTEESLGVPLKLEDRLPAPGLASVADGQAVGARAD
jgi:sporulation protein YlmC with PRC-barrel domain